MADIPPGMQPPKKRSHVVVQSGSGYNCSCGENFPTLKLWKRHKAEAAGPWHKR